MSEDLTGDTEAGKRGSYRTDTKKGSREKTDLPGRISPYSVSACVYIMLKIEDLKIPFQRSPRVHVHTHTRRGAASVSAVDRCPEEKWIKVSK